MPTFKIVLRNKKQDDTYNVCIRLTHKRESVYLKTNYFLYKNQLDGQGKVIKHDNALLFNKRLREVQSKYEEKIDTIILQAGNMSVKEIKKFLLTEKIFIKPKLLECIKNKMNEHQKAYEEKRKKGLKASNKTFCCYQTLRNSLFDFLKPKNFVPSEDPEKDFKTADIYLEEVNVQFLKKYEKFLTEKGLENGRWNKMKDLRAIYNNEIREGCISADLYPFKKYNINKLKKQTEPNILDTENLQIILRTEPLNLDERNARKTFLLDFMLLGINPADLYQFGTGETEIKNNRFFFDRSKTDVINSIKIEPEAQQLIQELSGKETPLFFQEKYNCHENFNKYTNKFLKRYAKNLEIEEFTLGYARYTWATIAFNDLDTDESTIDIALGHKTSKTVAGAHYIKKYRNKVDIANRKMIDYLKKLASPSCDNETGEE